MNTNDSHSSVFENIYQQSLWAGGSGTGALHENNIDYVALVSKFMLWHEVRSVVDYGCGDWQFSRFINWDDKEYHGIDVAPSVIASNSARYATQSVRFTQLQDTTEIPWADLILCKDVFQHLPNADVMQLLERLKSRCRWLIATNDDYPSDNLNGVIQAGGWRAVRLDLDPFNEHTATLLSWVVVSRTPTVRKRVCLIEGLLSAHEVRFARVNAAEADSNPIPMRVYQTWKSKSVLPANFEIWSRTIKDKNPSFEVSLWDDDDNHSFVDTNFPWFKEKYYSYDKEIMRVDVTRYFYLFLHGGFYMDLDVECLKSLDRYLSSADIIFGQMGADQAFHDAIPNAIMAARPRQDFWLFVFSHLLRGASHGPPEVVTGPSFLTYCIRGWKKSSHSEISRRIDEVKERLSSNQLPVMKTKLINILPHREWYPIDWSDPLHQRIRREVLGGRLLASEEKEELFPNSTLVTYWAHSW